MSVIRNLVYKKLGEYKNISISYEYKMYKDLSIYGDDFEELIEELSSEIGFDINNFFDVFERSGYYNPPEIYLNLPKIFYIDIGELLKGKIVYRTIDTKGKDITVGELIQMLEHFTR